MKSFSKSYDEEESGFNGSCEAYLISTQKENLLNWLQKETPRAEQIYKSIQKLTGEILIVKNLNVDEKFQGQGFGTQILCDLINDSYTNAAILVCDIGESQKEGFILEKFYESHDFKTIATNNDYPLMVYPQELALAIISELNTTKKIQCKP